MTQLTALSPKTVWQWPDWQEHRDAIAAVLCALLLLLAWLSHAFGITVLELLMLGLAYVIGGYESAKEGLTTLVGARELDVDLLMIVAALGAAGLGIWQQDYTLILDGAVLILIFAISGALEGFATQRTAQNIRNLMAATPDTARVISQAATSYQETTIAVEQVEVGDWVLVKPGELIPVDARIVAGQSAVNQAPITGESVPVDKAIGDTVFAGSLNGHGVLTLQVETAPESSLIQRVIRLVEQAQTEAPPSQQFVERFERIYARAIVIIGILLALLPPVWLGWDWRTTIYRALIFLVVASPCALVASIMPALLSGIASGARNGILYKNGAQLEAVGQIKAIAFDKTGTLTTGEIQVMHIFPTDGHTADHVLALAAALETFSEHPIGAAIVKAANAKNLPLTAATQVQVEAGRGIVGQVDGLSVAVGKAQFVAQPDTTMLFSLPPESAGDTTIWVVQDHQTIGAITLTDTLRPNAKDVIQDLQAQGVEHVVMLTGDSQAAADKVAQAVGIETVYAELLPEDKLNVIRELQAQYGSVAMVGDGINDAPALAIADVGIALGGVSTDVALETADMILMANQLNKLPQAIRQGQRANRVIKQNIAFALSFIGLLLGANFLGDLNLPQGVIGHEGSTLMVTLSGLRLLK
jgi:Cd2+/Zn2+-exporting ATPase